MKYTNRLETSSDLLGEEIFVTLLDGTHKTGKLANWLVPINPDSFMDAGAIQFADNSFVPFSNIWSIEKDNGDLVWRSLDFEPPQKVHILPEKQHKNNTITKTDNVYTLEQQSKQSECTKKLNLSVNVANRLIEDGRELQKHLATMYRKINDFQDIIKERSREMVQDTAIIYHSKKCDLYCTIPGHEHVCTCSTTKESKIPIKSHDTEELRGIGV